jgi:ABC-2 type transport system ATP-binding protein
MIEVVGLTKYYGNKPGVRDVSFTIARGETIGLLGPNGAGKTTILKMLAGHMLPSSGSITIDGIDAIDRPKDVAKLIGFLPEIPPLYVEMDVYGYLDFVGKIKGIKNSELAAHLKKIMDLTAITSVKERLIRNLSKGYRQRVGLAHALVGFPPVLILDEPTVGLDPKQITEVRSLIEALSREHTILLSSHILSEVKATCKRIMIVNNGRVVLEDTVENLEEGGASFSLRVRGEPDRTIELLRNISGVTGVEPADHDYNGNGQYYRFLVTGTSGPALREKIFLRFAAENMPIVEMRTIGNTLEEVFLESTSSQTKVLPKEQ